MTESMFHPTQDRIEAYADGTLPAADQAVVESHVLECGHCRAAVDDWRTLFDGLAALPRPEPSAGFAERVIAAAPVRPAWLIWLDRQVTRLVPSTNRGWALALALLALPALAVGGGIAWLATRPWLTAQGLWIFVTERLVDGTSSLLAAVAGALLERQSMSWLSTIVETVRGGLEISQLGVGIGAFAVLTTLSAWVLYRNLFRNPTREDDYVSYCF